MCAIHEPMLWSYLVNNIQAKTLAEHRVMLLYKDYCFSNYRGFAHKLTFSFGSFEVLSWALKIYWRQEDLKLHITHQRILYL